MDNALNHPTFYGKILVFGEYSVIEWPWAVLLPYTSVSAGLVIPESPDAQSLRSNRILQDFSEFLEHLQHRECTGANIDIEKLNEDLKKGLYLKSDIPENYGLGSSGALCAAIYRSYGYKNPVLPMAALRENFSIMESYFHGASSGVDPLSIYLREPLVIKKGEYYLPGCNGDFKKNAIKPFMINTRIKSKTAPLVKLFKENILQATYRKRFTGEYVPLVKQAVEQWVKGKLSIQTVIALSLEQIQVFKPMIPENLLGLWQEGAKNGLYGIKLCGSGGGGMLLGFAADIQAARDHIFRNYNLNIELLPE